MDESLTASIQALAEPIVTGQQSEVVALTCRPQSGMLLVRLLVDRAGGVTVQDCARINQLVGQALDQAGLIGQSYTLEVSSPGLDRPLTSHRDFERSVGEDLRLFVRMADGKTRETRGQLLAVQREAIVLTTSSGNVTILLAEIQSAKKVIRL